MAGAMDDAPDMGLLLSSDAPESAPVDEMVEEDDGELSDEELMFAEDLGFDESKALALRGFIEACMARKGPY